MSNLLKDVYHKDFLNDLGNKINQYDTEFPVERFSDLVTTENWEDLTLRARMKQIATVIGELLNGNYEEQLIILLKLHEENRGFNYLFFPDFVSIYGQDPKYFDLSMSYLKKMTPYSSSEFAIRPFLEKEPERVLEYCLTWSTHDNPDVRRLASEGTRLYLPWGNHVTYLKHHPEVTIPILENLKADESLYVRKSVANHLNDLSKIAPELIINLVTSWYQVNSDTDWILKKASRTLFKQGNPAILALFGYQSPGASYSILEARIKAQKDAIYLGEDLVFHYDIKTSLSHEELVRLEYVIGYVKANGQIKDKKFFISDTKTSLAKLSGSKSLSFKDLSTRKHYPGVHELSLYLNGHKVAETSFLVSEK